jgi:RNA polymerase-binding transcription factor DksA
MTRESNIIHVASRNADLRQMLIERRHEIQDKVESRGDIELALLQMRADTLKRIDEALVRLDTGMYGFCFECEREISERRLRALPFVGRCQACEDRLEPKQGRARQLASDAAASRSSRTWSVPELTAMLHMLHGLCTHAGVHVAIRDERVEQLLTETDIRQIAVALDQGLDTPLNI